MRIEQVSAPAFGPLTKATLDFAPGLTIVYGPNESGKSSWHAALYVGVCGVRRSRGAGTTEDREFEALHKPWDGALWEVGATVRLEDGRGIELHFDLGGRVDCSARDTVLGRDVSNEIMNGTPDASRWLGLDRRSFLATACIRQADLLSVLSQPALLQEHMQRAAATAGTDATAAAAIARLEEFKKERVGADMVHSRKPLRAAKAAYEKAETELRRARDGHDRFSQLAARGDRARKRAAESEHQLRVLKAAVDAEHLAQLEQRLARATELDRRYPAGAPPGLVRDDQLINTVAAALQAWEQAPGPIPLTGPTSEEIARDLERLPDMPQGDREPDPGVVAAVQEMHRAEQAIELLGEMPEPTPEPPAGLDEQRLIELARDLEISEPLVDPTLEAGVQRARTAVEDGAHAHSGPLWPITAVILAVAGVATLLAHLIVPGIAALVGAIGTAAWILNARVARTRTALRAMKSLQEAEASLGADRYRIEEIRSRRAAAMREIAAAGLPDDPAALRRTAEELAEGQRARRRFQEWQVKRTDATRAAESAGRRLAAALEDRGSAISGDTVENAYADYVAGCRERAGLATEAAKRPQLETALDTRLGLESAAAEAERIRSEASAMLQSTAASLGKAAESEEADVGVLHDWQARHASEVEAAEVAFREWTELQSILDGTSLEEFKQEVGSRWAAVARESTELVDEEIRAVTFEGDGREELADAEASTRADRTEADQLDGTLKTEAQALPSVPEAEEELAKASVELDRVQGLERTLGQTLTFLRAAQDRVHHDIAPILNQTLCRWLPQLTSGRYVDATVDPPTLEVRVKSAGGKWRTAKYLSQGTREQIYLLLRIALAEHLTKPGEVIPLILDDVTVQSDAIRTGNLLAILKRVSEDRQIILFTQEDDVLRWARAHLGGGRDRLIELDPAAIPA